jgi:hypothetical protein
VARDFRPVFFSSNNPKQRPPDSCSKYFRISLQTRRDMVEYVLLPRYATFQGAMPLRYTAYTVRNGHAEKSYSRIYLYNATENSVK